MILVGSGPIPFELGLVHGCSMHRSLGPCLGNELGGLGRARANRYALVALAEMRHVGVGHQDRFRYHRVDRGLEKNGGSVLAYGQADVTRVAVGTARPPHFNEPSHHREPLESRFVTGRRSFADCCEPAYPIKTGGLVWVVRSGLRCGLRSSEQAR